MIYPVVTATLIGLPYVQRLRGHVNVDLISLSLPLRARMALAIFTLLMSCLIVVVMLWKGYEYWHFTWSRGWRSDTVWGVRLWMPYAALPLGFTMFLLRLIADLVAVLLKVVPPFGLDDN